MTQVVKATKVAEFKRVFDELDKGRIFVRICDIRRKLNYSREEFDQLLVAMRDAEMIQLHVGDASTVTQDELADGFVDENGFRMGTVTLTSEFEVLDIETTRVISEPTEKSSKKTVKVADFQAAFNELDKGRIFVRICDLRKKMNLPREVFDEMLRKLRDAEVIQLHEGDNSTMTADERADCFTDENGVRMGTITFIGNSNVTEIEINVAEPEVQEVADFDYAKLTVKELKEIAKSKKIRGYYKMRKAQLVGILSGKIEAPKAETKYTVKLLREVAKSRGIKGYSKMRKAELEAALSA